MLMISKPFDASTVEYSLVVVGVMRKLATHGKSVDLQCVRVVATKKVLGAVCKNRTLLEARKVLNMLRAACNMRTILQ